VERKLHGSLEDLAHSIILAKGSRVDLSERQEEKKKKKINLRNADCQLMQENNYC
jgi:hypothetical protein